MTDIFRPRCVSALTHPVTLAALAVLLVNDLVFKSLWPHPWTTGKLSDLAWMVFAPPLMAYLLSFAARENLRAQRATFGVAFAGLPLLYAAFNTFAPLHDGIMRAFSIVTGGSNNSPLDPWDSVVIPVSIAVALWVWRRGPLAPGGLRSRLGMVAAGLAAFATVATSENQPDPGIQLVGTSPEGVVAGQRHSVDSAKVLHVSDDGGLNWNPANPVRIAGAEENTFWGWNSEETTTGTYSIEGPNILLQFPGEKPMIVFSATYLSESSNRWLQEKEGREIEEIGVWQGREVSSGPTSLIYDPRSGNVVAALGTQGVVVARLMDFGRQEELEPIAQRTSPSS